MQSYWAKSQLFSADDPNCSGYLRCARFSDTKAGEGAGRETQYSNRHTQRMSLTGGRNVI